MSKKFTEKDFINRLMDLGNGEYRLLEKYIDSRTKVLILHKVCGFKYKVKPNNFSNGKRCPKCAGVERKTTKSFSKEIKKIVGREYIVVGEYKNTHTGIKMLHKKCGHEWSVHPAHFLSGTRCPKCSGVEMGNTEDFGNFVFESTSGEYSLIGEYVTTDTKTFIKHNKCRNIWKITPYKFKTGRRCPKCSLKQTESRLATKLKEHFASKYSASIEYRIVKNPKTNRFLPYDIYIDKYKCFIEINGEQHYVFSNKFFKTKKNFNTRKTLDKIKRKYAEKHGTYVEIDIRKYNVDSAIKYIESKILK